MVDRYQFDFEDMGFPRNSLELYGIDPEMFEYLDFDMKIE
jgi:hypothetical protein